MSSFAMPSSMIGKASVGLMALIWLFTLIAMLPVPWAKSDDENVTLWKSQVCCVGKSSSTSTSDRKGCCNGTRLFAIVTFIGCTVLLVMMLMPKFTLKQKLICFGVTNFCCLLAWAIYAGQFGVSGYKYSAGFGLEVTSWVFLLFLGGMIYMDDKGAAGGSFGGGGSTSTPAPAKTEATSNA